MRIKSAIKERLEQNAQQHNSLQQGGRGISRKQEIRLEYLRIEAQALNDMLHQIHNKRWQIFRDKRISLFLSILGMSIYVLGIFYMFKELDLSKVEQWQFAVTAMPFWLILTIIPVAIITFLTARNSRL
jgi:hypothetical protein